MTSPSKVQDNPVLQRQKKVWGLVLGLLSLVFVISAAVFVSAYTKCQNGDDQSTLSAWAGGMAGAILVFVILAAIIFALTKYFGARKAMRTFGSGVRLFTVTYLSLFIAAHSSGEVIINQQQLPVGKLLAEEGPSTGTGVSSQPSVQASITTPISGPLHLLSTPDDMIFGGELVLTNISDGTTQVINLDGSQLITNATGPLPMLWLVLTNGLELNLTSIGGGLVGFQDKADNMFIAKPQFIIYVYCGAAAGAIGVGIWLGYKIKACLSNLAWTKSNANWKNTNGVLDNDTAAFSPPPPAPFSTPWLTMNIVSGEKSSDTTGTSNTYTANSIRGMEIVYTNLVYVCSYVSSLGWTMGDGKCIPVTPVMWEQMYRLYPTNVVLLDTNVSPAVIRPCIFEWSTNLEKWTPAVGPGGTVGALSEWYTADPFDTNATPMMTVLYIGGMACYTNVSYRQWIGPPNPSGYEIRQEICHSGPNMTGPGRDRVYLRARPGP